MLVVMVTIGSRKGLKEPARETDGDAGGVLSFADLLISGIDKNLVI
jgi:hypothetical protein